MSARASAMQSRIARPPISRDSSLTPERRPNSTTGLPAPESTSRQNSASLDDPPPKALSIEQVAATTSKSTDYSVLSPSRSVDSSTASLDNGVKVLVRIRPVNERETSLSKSACALRQLGSQTVHIKVEERDYSFQFDDILGQSVSQEEVFQLVGQPVVNNVMQGYNACCFAYGQTGAGKTHTMQGELVNEADGSPNQQRGLAPRVFQSIFQAIESIEGKQADGELQYTCRCSFLQIYNEQISDLLDKGERPLALRYDAKSGVYVENLKEVVVVNAEDAMKLMLAGARNRKIGETNMNRSSSRSHSVFTMKVECRSLLPNGLTNVRFGTLHMVDLAGSERVRLSGATGAALTEASEINLSLTCLGRVIRKVVDAQRSKTGAVHVPYRDSKLTFLLQDSLGGNAKTMVVANVSPSVSCASETLSTLQFAERAKAIQNRAKVNVDTLGDIQMMQAEIDRLKAELKTAQMGVLGPVLAEREQLKGQLDEEANGKREAQAKLEGVMKENLQLKFQMRRLDAQLVEKDRGLADADQKLTEQSTITESTLKGAVDAATAACEVKHQEALEAEKQRAAAEMEALQADLCSAAARVAEVEAACKAQHEADILELKRKQTAAFSTALAAYETQLQEREQQLHAQNEAAVQSLRAELSLEHSMRLEELQREHVSSRAEDQAFMSAALDQLREEHTSKLIVARKEDEARQSAAERELNEAHAEELASLRREGQAMLDGERARLEAELRSAQAASNGELARVRQDAEAQLEAARKELDAEHGKAMDARRERHKGILTSMKRAHEDELAKVTHELEAERTAHVEVKEELRKTHASLESMSERLAAIEQELVHQIQCMQEDIQGAGAQQQQTSKQNMKLQELLSDRDLCQACLQDELMTKVARLQELQTLKEQRDEQIRAQRTAQNEERVRLREELASVNEKHKETKELWTDVKRELEAAKAQAEASTNALQRKTSDCNRLQEQLELEREKHADALGDQKREHTKVVSSLQARVRESSEQVLELQTSLDTKKKKRSMSWLVCNSAEIDV